MKLNPATLLVLIMFGSFVVILGIMIAIFRPDSPRSQAHLRRARVTQPTSVPEMRADTVGQMAQTDTQAAGSETRASAAASSKQKPVSPQTSPTAQASRQVYRQLEQEQKEMAQLRKDLEKRLQLALAEHRQKLKQLARRCEPLEPGEAVQILLPLSDADLATVLGHMQPSKAAPVVALLKRHGREKAISKMK